MNIWQKIINHPKTGLVILAYIAFIALGMPDGLLGVAWPSLRAGFGIPIDAVGMLLTASVSGYLTSAFFSGAVISRLGVGKVLAISCALTGAALIGYTLVPIWGLMVGLGVLAGLGAGAIDAGLNSYVAANFGEGLMQWLHASYGIGVTLGPIIMTFSLTNFDSWRLGYRIVGVFQLILTVSFLLTVSMWTRSPNQSNKAETKLLTDYKTPFWQTLKQAQVWLSALLFLVYCGAEVSFGTWTYSLLTESRGIEPGSAGLVAGSYWAMFTIGRIVAGLYAKKAGLNRLVVVSTLVALIGSLLLVWNPFPLANLIAVGLIGLAIAPIFPALMSGTVKRVGMEHAANAIGLQMAFASLGTTLLPSLLGVIARWSSLEIIPVGQGILFLLFLGLYQLSQILGREKSRVSVEEAI